jgi:hypothetical protein
MKRGILFVVRWGLFISLCGLPPSSYGQQSELNADAYSGLFFFRGNGSASRSVIDELNLPALSSYTANPYGRGSGFSYGFELQGQIISRDNNLYGLGIGFEELTSKVAIGQLNISGTLSVLVNGKTQLHNDFITVHPFAGHRFVYHNVEVDCQAGMEAGICLASREIGRISSAPESRVNDHINKPRPSADVRPGVQVEVTIDRWGLSAGYSVGLTNYQTEDNLKAYSNFIRLGLSYQLLR